MFEIRLGPCHRDWFVWEGDRLWDHVGYANEWDAIDALRESHPDEAAELYRFFTCV